MLHERHDSSTRRITVSGVVESQAGSEPSVKPADHTSRCVREAEPVSQSPGGGGQSHSSATNYHQPAQDVCIRSQASIRDLDDTAGRDRGLSLSQETPSAHPSGRPTCFRRLHQLDGSDWIGVLASQQTCRHQKTIKPGHAAHHLDSTPLSRHPPENQQTPPSIPQPHPASRTNIQTRSENAKHQNEPQPKTSPKSTQVSLSLFSAVVAMQVK